MTPRNAPPTPQSQPYFSEISEYGQAYIALHDPPASSVNYRVEACQTGESILRVEVFPLRGLDGTDFFAPQTAETAMGSTLTFSRTTSSGSSVRLLNRNSSLAFIGGWPRFSEILVALFLRACDEPDGAAASG